MLTSRGPLLMRFVLLLLGVAAFQLYLAFATHPAPSQGERSRALPLDNKPCGSLLLTLPLLPTSPWVRPFIRGGLGLLFYSL